MSWLRSLVPETENGRVLVLGILLLAVGLLFAWPPLALIVPGALLIVLSFITPPAGGVP